MLTKKGFLNRWVFSGAKVTLENCENQVEPRSVLISSRKKKIFKNYIFSNIFLCFCYFNLEITLFWGIN